MKDQEVQAVSIIIPELDFNKPDNKYIVDWTDGADIVFRDKFYMNFDMKFSYIYSALENGPFEICSTNGYMDQPSGKVKEGWRMEFSLTSDKQCQIQIFTNLTPNISYLNAEKAVLGKPIIIPTGINPDSYSLKFSLLRNTASQSIQVSLTIMNDNYDTIGTGTGIIQNIPVDSAWRELLVFPEKAPSIEFNANKSQEDNYHHADMDFTVQEAQLSDNALFSQQEAGVKAVSAQVKAYMDPSLFSETYEQGLNFTYSSSSGKSFNLGDISIHSISSFFKVEGLLKAVQKNMVMELMSGVYTLSGYRKDGWFITLEKTPAMGANKINLKVYSLYDTELQSEYSFPITLSAGGTDLHYFHLHFSKSGSINEKIRGSLSFSIHQADSTYAYKVSGQTAAEFKISGGSFIPKYGIVSTAMQYSFAIGKDYYKDYTEGFEPWALSIKDMSIFSYNDGLPISTEKSNLIHYFEVRRKNEIYPRRLYDEKFFPLWNKRDKSIK